MQSDSATSLPERETIELPEISSDGREKSALARAAAWMAVLLIGGAALYGIYFHGASQASGSTEPTDSSLAPPNDSSRVSDLFTPGHDELPLMRADLSRTDGTLRLLAADPMHPQVSLSDLSRNPFRQPNPLSAAGHVQPTTAPGAQPTPEAERAAMLQTVEAMQLQSITATSHRSCKINDVLYDEGGILNGFTIEQINTQTVVIRNGLYRFELTMNH
jgi:hypothetical protein